MSQQRILELRKILDRLAVSYTHLDVYKRQKYDRTKVYKDYTDFEGERYNTYKVLSME